MTWDLLVRRGIRLAVLVFMAAAVFFVEVRHWSPARGVPALVLLGLSVVGMLLLWPMRRSEHRYVPVILLTTAALTVTLGILTPETIGGLFLFLPVSVVAIRWRIDASAAVLVGIVVAYVGGTWLVWQQWPDWWLLGGLAGSYLGGLLDHAHQDRVRQSAELVVQEQRAQVAEARSATLAERSRIAREIHDVLAHSLAALAVQLEAADALLGAGREGEAREVVRTSRRLAREGLAETKQAVLALREGASAPLPESLSALLATTAPRPPGPVPAASTPPAPVPADSVPAGSGPAPAAGAPVATAPAPADGEGTGWDPRLRVDGAVREVPEEASFALYRIAQEALTNATKHAAGAAVRMVLAYTDDQVALTVRNGPAPDGAPTSLAAAGGGYGLTGMRERLEPLGGSLDAGPLDGGWQVAARIPV
ncbi:sensor histidine kinase [Actinocatenispora thailandica]|uniref:sensor histidine kinase n=1 Tax=Actinocatenispora thailandica TaxID=227318 RepID=UPI00194FEF43|nr:histidine kinase [Actinocatenispora thailandica]